VVNYPWWSPVEGATVTLEPGGMSMVTGPDGTYRFDGFPAGHYTLTATKDGSCPLSSGVVNRDISEQQLGEDLILFGPIGDDGWPICEPEQE